VGEGTRSKSGGSFTWSLGARYDLSGPLSAPHEYTRYAIDKAKGGAGDFNVLMLSAVIGF
jgi:hypothetical protein